MVNKRDIVFTVAGIIVGLVFAGGLFAWWTSKDLVTVAHWYSESECKKHISKSSQECKEIRYWEVMSPSLDQ